MPEKLHELQRLWLIEATRYNVLPLTTAASSGSIRRSPAGRTDQGHHADSIRRNGRLSENSVINIKNKSHSITAEIVVPTSGVEGVIVAQGGNVRRLEPLREGRQAEILLQLLGAKAVLLRGPGDPGRGHQVRMEFAYDGGGLGKGGKVSLYVDGKKVGEGQWRHGADDFLRRRRCDVGEDTGTPVSSEYGAHDNAFNGKVRWVQIDLGSDTHDHFITPEQRLNLAMARQ